MKNNYNLVFQLSDNDARAKVDFTECNYTMALRREVYNFNGYSKSGKITNVIITPKTFSLVYECDADLVKPGAAVHFLSQSLVENYPEFENMLTVRTVDGKHRKLFESK